MKFTILLDLILQYSNYILKLIKKVEYDLFERYMSILKKALLVEIIWYYIFSFTFYPHTYKRMFGRVINKNGNKLDSVVYW